ncbi:hypothetical protein F4V43_14005 [Paenibacillus spiritus]|uniref:TPM domain-containing protein n=1 Tax=Paenibacillus spiritus TaxID=2496557 RepID=A0A5J5G276_9BACL|nr:hypothetical protein F4V43_14005 [Paenibacillus spiritus]
MERVRLRKSLPALLLSTLLFLLGVPAASAAAIPSPGGAVVDQAGLLGSGQADAVAKQAEQGPYAFRILILPSLDGESSEQYAYDVYESWGLAENELLLLIGSEDRTVDLHFMNPGLQAALNAWSANQGGGSGSEAIKQLLDTYFIPYAKEGDFGKAILSVIGATHAIGGDAGAESGASGGSGPGAGAAAGSSGGSDSGTRGTGTSAGSPAAAPRSGTGTDGSSRSLVYILAGAVLAGLILYVTVTGIRRRRQLRASQEAISDLLVRANRGLEALQPFQGIVQGKTQQLADTASRTLSDLLVKLSALSSEQQSGSLPAFYRLGALSAANRQLQGAESELRTALEEQEKSIAAISEADRTVKQHINELKQAAPELQSEFQDALQETGYGLEDIADDLKELAEQTAEADKLELFDPIAAQTVSAQARELQEQISRDVQDVDVYQDKIHGFPAALAAARSEIAALIEQNALQNMKVKPYELLKQAEADVALLEEELRGGDLNEVRRIGAEMDRRIEDAVSMTKRQAEIRLANRRDLNQIREGWKELGSAQERLRSLIASASARYARSHIEPAEAALAEWSRRLREAEAGVPEIEAWTADERGEFDKAREGLDRLLALQDEARRLLGEAAGDLGELDNRLARVEAALRQGEADAEAARRLLQSRGLHARDGLAGLPPYRDLQAGLSAGPYQLDALEASARAFLAGVAAYAEEAQRLVRRKEEEERLAQMAAMQAQMRREAERRGGPGGFGGRPGGGGGHSSGSSSWGGGGSGHSSGGSKW